MKDITLTPSQAVALEQLKAFSIGQSGFSLTTLEGYAGTGKTTLVAFLLDAMRYMDMRIAVMAPTNKAVAVLQEKIGNNNCAEYGSLHSFLGLRLTEKEDGSQACNEIGRSTLHEFDIAIIDECSMVSESLFTAIMTRRHSCRILFVGDPAQLPPVEDSHESPVFRLVTNRIRLSEVVRQARDNPVIAASMVVRRAIEAMRRTSLQELAEAFPAQPAAAGIMSGGMPAIVDTIIHEQRSQRNCRAIAWKNKTVEAINSAVHHALFPDCQAPFSVGEIVMAQEEFKGVSDHSSSYQKPVRVFNSEELTVVDIRQENHPQFPEIKAWSMSLERDDGSTLKAFYPANKAGYDAAISQLWETYRKQKTDGDFSAKKTSDHAWALKRAFATIRHAYAITAHKSQGSTFDTALVCWDDINQNRNDFDFNRMIYVAMTRAALHMAIVTK